MKIYSIILITLFSLKSLAQSNSAIIKGHFDFANDHDTVMLTIYSRPSLGIKSTTVKTINNGKYAFKIHIDKSPSYVTITFPNRSQNADASKDIRGFLIERRDSINYSIIGNKQIFWGRGSKKWIIQNDLAKITRSPKSKYEHNESISNVIEGFRFYDSLYVLKSRIISRNRKALGSFKSKLLMVDNIGSTRFYKCQTVKYSKANLKDLISYVSNYKEKLTTEYFTKKDSSAIFSASISYCASVIELYRRDSCFLLNERFSISKCYQYINKSYSGFLRDNLLALLLYSNRKSFEDFSYYLNDAITTVKDTSLLKYFKIIKQNRFEGSKAHDFELNDTANNHISLSKLKGKKILLDFWFTGCTPCKYMAIALKKLDSTLSADGVVIVSINIDKSRKTWIASVKSGLYTAPNAVNLNTGISGMDHLLIKNYSITGFPTLLIIDQYGNLKRSPRNPTTDNGEDLISLFK